MRRINDLAIIYSEMKKHCVSMSYPKFIGLLTESSKCDTSDKKTNDITNDSKRCRRIVLGLEAIPPVIGKHYKQAQKNKKILQLEKALENLEYKISSIELLKSLCEHNIIIDKNLEVNASNRIAEIIFDEVAYRYSHESTINIEISVKSGKFIFKPDSSKLIERKLKDQRQEYLDQVEKYTMNNIDRFFVLQRLAEKMNAYACYELGDLYYYGVTLKYDQNTEWSISPNFEKACDYYVLAMYQGHIPAIWGLGDLYLNNKVNIDNGQISIFDKLLYRDLRGRINCTNEEIAESLFKCAIEIKSTYAPALNSLGIIELEHKAQKYIRHDEKNNNWIFEENALTHIRNALKYFKKATEQDLVYSYNRIAQFLYSSKYEQFIRGNWDSIASVLKCMNPEDYLKKAADLKNPWAMNRLANYYFYPQGKIEEAKSLFEEAAEYGHRWAQVNLKEKFKIEK